LSWHLIDNQALFSGSGRIDLTKVFPDVKGRCWAYLRATVTRSDDEQVKVELRSDDQSIVWLNERYVGRHLVVGPGERYFTRLELPLKRGENRLLVAVHQVHAFWEISLQPCIR